MSVFARRSKRAALLCAVPLVLLPLAASGQDAVASRVDKTTYHNDRQRTGWNDRETILTPETVASHRFGLIWESPEFDRYEGREARMQASPLYLDSVLVSGGQYSGKRFSIAYLASTNGYVYAVNTAEVDGVAPGTILWRSQLATKPCGTSYEMVGILATPVIDTAQNRIYVSACDDVGQWQVHALDVRSGMTISGWPLAIDAKNVNRPGVIKNGKSFPSTLMHWQRGALNMSPDKTRLYLSFGKDGQSGWLVSVDTTKARVASAFSTTAITDEMQGGMWASGGPSVDDQGRVYIATGASFLQAVTKKMGLAGVYSESDHSWGQSIIQLEDNRKSGFKLIGTYTPFNYCQAVSKDIDLGSSGTIVFDIPTASGGATRLLALSGAKQGNFYLLDRDRMPGGLVRRQPCSDDPSSDKSLLNPNSQTQWGKRGPLNLFGPYSEESGMLNSAKSRSTAAFFTDATGNHYVFASGSSKKGADFSIPTPPGIAKVRIVAPNAGSAYPDLDTLEETQTLFNPGSPVISSNGGSDAVVWVMDPNAPRMTLMYGPNAPRPTLYAFDADRLRLLWKSGPNDLFTSGKYNEPAVVNGLVLVGTDRLQAFGLRDEGASAFNRQANAEPASAPASARPTSIGQTLFEGRCAACHTGDPAPSRATLAGYPRSRIIAALTVGPMQPIASDLSRDQIDALADFLTSK